MKFDKLLEADYQFYLDRFGLQATKEEYRTLLKKANPNAMKDSLENYLKEFFFDTEVSVSEFDLKIKVKDRGSRAWGYYKSLRRLSYAILGIHARCSQITVSCLV